MQDGIKERLVIYIAFLKMISKISHRKMEKLHISSAGTNFGVSVCF